MTTDTSLQMLDKDGWIWVVLPDSVTMDNNIDIETRIRTALLPDHKGVVLDMARMEYFYSSAMGLFVRIRKLVLETGRMLCMVNVSQKIRDLMSSVNLTRLFPMYSTDVEFEISEGEVWNHRMSQEKFNFFSFAHTDKQCCRVNVGGHMTVLNDLSPFHQSVSGGEASTYVFDLSQLESIDSCGTTMISSVLSRIYDQGSVAVGFGASDAIRNLFSLLAIDKYITLYEDEKQALNGISRQ